MRAGTSLVSWRAMAAGLVVCLALLRLIYSSQVELLPEETYYWNYSRHLDLGLSRSSTHGGVADPRRRDAVRRN